MFEEFWKLPEEQQLIKEIYGKHDLVLSDIHAKMLWEAVN